jgi:hypothetical protein
MTRGFVRRRKDANHGEVQAIFEDLGAGVLDCSKFGTPFDLLIVWRGRWYVVEVKNGELSPSRRQLTDDEKEFHAIAALHGCKVDIINNETDAFALLGARRAV